ncbi:MAG: hypothetical protein JSR73_08185 [Proteobacteria bacterium]|nr:hypothetical protein [Pseudomonadota bacterium]
MIVTVARLTRQITRADFRAALAAINHQLRLHFRPEWGIDARVRGVDALPRPGRGAAIEGTHEAIIYVGDSSQDPTTGVGTARGYHSQNHRNVPYGFVYLDVCARNGSPWSRTLSHEVLELLADPTAVTTISGPAPGRRTRTVYYELEICDPTQADGYRIGRVVVSNFVGRAYFGLWGGSGRTNHLGLRLAPFGVRPGGYVQYEDHRGTHQRNGAGITARHLAARKLLGAGRRNERRRLRRAALPPGRSGRRRTGR